MRETLIWLACGIRKSPRTRTRLRTHPTRASHRKNVAPARQAPAKQVQEETAKKIGDRSQTAHGHAAWPSRSHRVAPAGPRRKSRPAVAASLNGAWAVAFVIIKRRFNGSAFSTAKSTSALQPPPAIRQSPDPHSFPQDPLPASGATGAADTAGAAAFTSSGIRKSRPSSAAVAFAASSRFTAARGLAPRLNAGQSRDRRTTLVT